MKEQRIWKFLRYDPEKWENCDLSIVDDILYSWLDRRERLIKNSKEYRDFMDQLKRRHAIETGVVERLYDIDRGVTETLILEGFDAALISHNDATIPAESLIKHLTDHLNAVDFVFDLVKSDRPLSKATIRELHVILTEHQMHTTAIDGLGQRVNTPLLKGEFKRYENNPARADGTKVFYCPPEHVDAEMDALLSIYQDLVEQGVHPVIIAAWLHHAFTTIHPFQDGNGRVVRLLASYILIKAKLFPITVLREEAKAKYIRALEAADDGDPCLLVDYFASIQRKHMEEALNLREMDQDAHLQVVASALREKLVAKRESQELAFEATIKERRIEVYEYCRKALEDKAELLQITLGEEATVAVVTPHNQSIVDGLPTYHQKTVSYAQKHNYFFNADLPTKYLSLSIHIKGKRYDLILTVHHYGYDHRTLAIGAFVMFPYGLFESERADNVERPFRLLELPPYLMSLSEKSPINAEKIATHIEHLLTAALAEILNSI